MKMNLFRNIQIGDYMALKHKKTKNKKTNKNKVKLKYDET